MRSCFLSYFKDEDKKHISGRRDPKVTYGQDSWHNLVTLSPLWHKESLYFSHFLHFSPDGWLTVGTWSSTFLLSFGVMGAQLPLLSDRFTGLQACKIAWQRASYKASYVFVLFLLILFISITLWKWARLSLSCQAFPEEPVKIACVYNIWERENHLPIPS